jgi:hypothetical protein
MAALTAFLDFIMVDAPGAGVDIVKQKILEACITFCDVAKAYTYELPAINVVAGQADYTLTPETGYRITDVMKDGVVYNGTPLNPNDPVGLDFVFGKWRAPETTGTPDYYIADVTRGTLTLVLTPDASITGGLVVTVSEAPLITATDVPDVLLSRYHQAIKHGALGNLMSMNKKPWKNTDLAAWHMQQFNTAIGRTDIERARGFTRRSLRTTTNFR